MSNSERSNAPVIILALIFSVLVSGLTANYSQPRFVYEDINHELIDIANPNANPILFNAGLAIFIISGVVLCGFIVLSIWKRRQ
jgi:hypothetical protein